MPTDTSAPEDAGALPPVTTEPDEEPARTLADAPGEPAPLLAAQARKDALAYAREVSELCMLAGFADRAARFIAAETSVAQVREALLEARAAADARLAVDGSREPRAGQMPASKDAGWGDAIARTFKKPEV